MSKSIINLSRAGNGNFKRSRPKWFEALWIFIEFLFVTNPLQISTGLRVAVLKTFGAHIGRNVIIRPRLRVKFPWNLQVDDNCWIGEGVWIHNQDKVIIESNSVISQESFITTGSHDAYETMDLIVKPVRIGCGVWITSRCMVLQGVEIGDNVVVTPGSVVNKSLPSGGIYGGNPAKFIKERSVRG